MLELRTGLPGAGKTLNTLYEVLLDSNKEYRSRPKYYNNIPLFYLDLDVCSSFSAYLYGHLLTSEEIKEFEKKIVRSRLLSIRRSGRFPELSDFPMYDELFQSWLDFGGHLRLFLYWCKRVYSPDQLKPLEDYLSLLKYPFGTQSNHLEELKQFNLHFTKLDDPREWYDLPRNSVVILDECQRFFPPRKVGSVVPKHISEFETHRHLAITVILITQNAGLIDYHVRKLINRHTHYQNPMASGSVVRYQWDGVRENIDYHARKEGDRKVLRRPKNVFGLYHSADIHTHKLRIPRKVYFLLALLIVVVCLVFYIPYSLGLAGGSDENVDDSLSLSDSFNPLPTTDNSKPSVSGRINSVAFNDPDDFIRSCYDLRFSGFSYTNNQNTFELLYFFSCFEKPPETDSDEDKPEPTSKTYDSIFLGYHGYRVVDLGRVIYLTNPDIGYQKYFQKFY